MSGWTICLEHEKAYRKVAKIQFTKEGGFSVILPYHSARRGLCSTMPVCPIAYADSRFEGVTPFSAASNFSATSRVKLTYHADGFVHFSGEDPETIRSGRYPDGSPKGLGLFSAPLSAPIESGPSVGVLCWGLE